LNRLYCFGGTGGGTTPTPMDGDGTCADGERCWLTCDNGAACTHTCEQGSTCRSTCNVAGGGCQQICQGNANCFFSCDGGNCTQTGGALTDCTASCDGGNCTETDCND
ncbi:MAG: hypothetical protein KJN97_11675, partial [Deltaproteobacteria bacterium]|nr:hypothetical protein [Deltaproteobacteria bacterium]